MGYPYEDQLIVKLQERDDLNHAIEDLTEKKNMINNQVKQWMKSNNLEKYKVESKNGEAWSVIISKSNRRTISDYDMLIRKLGDEASIFIKESASESIRITKKK